MLTLNEKVAFVTGGTRGMGLAIVNRLVAEGSAVAFTYAKSDDKAQAIVAEIRQRGGKALAIKADAAIKNAVANAIEEAAKTFGKIDILVNNAAIAVAGPIETAADRSADYDRQIDVNIRAVAEAVRAVQKYMPDGGRIINIGSVGGRKIGTPHMADYAATKAAIEGFSRGLAWDFAPRNITVNTIEPGAIDTDMMPADPAVREAFINAIPLKRLGKTEEIAALVNFLAGPESGYITGSNIAIDGGILA
ncbi:3-oxoacyl-ACP reductase FabG [Chitinophaga filiformis]|uniref:3-oxoacyl-ACP reductase family protein n=1 Tax=Chitinophaga filiformis TaxID=104663 RepID=UPI001F27256E|nr:3-oxoacyl-ACP reductase family protein [Chitinophaga filiformis]MCF6407772.1 3-oxoacyl-ACP reductase FabG [Chitinophaga filiformis]